MTTEAPNNASADTGSREIGPTPPPVFDRPRPKVLVLLLVLGLLALIAFAVLGYQTFSLRLEAARKLDNARALVEQADGIVVGVDEVVRAKVEPELAKEARAALEDAKQADEKLAEAVALIDAAHADLNDDEQEQADLLRRSATTRREMLSYAPPLLEANAEAASSLTPADEGWEALLAADKLSDRAVKAYNKLTKAGVRESQKLNRQAAEELAESKKRFEAAEEAFSAAPFEDYIAYVSTRIKLNRLSQQSDKAWLAGEVAKANKIIAQYNKLDATAVKQASGLPATPDAVVATAFGAATDALTEKYYAARDTALKADKALREY